MAETSIEKPNRNGKGMRKRTGIYTSCLIATDENDHQAALFQTNIGHSGEWIVEYSQSVKLAFQCPLS